MLTIVASTKGGVGKSTFSMQVLAPYMLTRLGSATVLELDDQNHDSADLNNSQIKSRQVVVGSNINRAIDEMTPYLSNGNYVIDVGGNKTCDLAIEAMGKGGVDQLTDLIVIPVSQRGRDIQNAQKTLDLITKHFEDFQGRVVIGVTRIIEGTTLDDVMYAMPDIEVLLNDERVSGLIVLPNNETVATSLGFGVSSYELAINADEVLTEIKSKLNEQYAATASDKDNPEITDWVRRKRSVRNAVEFKGELDRIFDELDALVEDTVEVGA